MTHGDKGKAKTVKSSKASGKESRAPEAVQSGKAGSEKGNGKAVAQVAAKGAASGKAGRESGAGAESPSSSGKATASAPRLEKSRARANGNTGEGGISNPVIADSFSRAVKKYPNAFRKLTD